MKDTSAEYDIADVTDVQPDAVADGVVGLSEM